MKVFILSGFSLKSHTYDILGVFTSKKNAKDKIKNIFSAQDLYSSFSIDEFVVDGEYITTENFDDTWHSKEIVEHDNF